MFHLVGSSFLPIVTSFILMFLTTSLVVFFNYGLVLIVLVSVSMVLLIFWNWASLVAIESESGYHSSLVVDGFKLGMALFIFREVMFFVSFFITWIDRKLSPSLELGRTWAPVGIYIIDPMAVPLLNTMVLLTSGATLTWAHAFLLNDKSVSVVLFITCVLGMYFTLLQLIEYMESRFSLEDSIFGSLFFLTTGFHGFHVLIGSVYLLVNLVWSLTTRVSSLHSVGFELASIYWHFVDVVWIMLYLLFYL